MRNVFLISFFYFSIVSDVFAQAYCTIKKSTELRAEPNIKSQVRWRVKKYMPLQGTGKVEKSWLEVLDVDGASYWARRKDLSSRTKCLVVAVKHVRIRKGPGSNFDPINPYTYDRYSPFKDLGGEDGWTKVQSESGASGWVNLDHVWKPMGKKMRMSFGTN